MFFLRLTVIPISPFFLSLHPTTSIPYCRPPLAVRKPKLFLNFHRHSSALVSTSKLFFPSALLWGAAKSDRRFDPETAKPAFRELLFVTLL